MDTDSKRKGQSKQSNRKSKGYALVQEPEEVIYGVTLNKMRKILTIRTPYVIENRTLFDYVIRITYRLNQNQ